MLKVLLLRKKVSEKTAALEELRKSSAGFDTREAEIAKDIEAASTDEEKKVVEEAAEAFDKEKVGNQTQQTTLAEEIAGIEKEIKDIEEAAPAPGGDPGTDPSGSGEARKGNHHMETRKFYGMTMQERDAFFVRDDVKDFLQRVRQFTGQKRDITGGELGIPEVMLGILRDNVSQYSKLLSHITCKPVKGKARQNIAGAVPEAVWTEAIANLNELHLSFSQIEVDGYMVGGYLAIPNATLEDDDDLGLASTVLDMLGQSIGVAVDKAIVYGNGNKMPVGYITRLAATVQPSWWGPNQGDFTDLHSSNLLKLDLTAKTGTEFFTTLVTTLAIASPKYAVGGPVWVCNRKTHIDLMTKALAFNASAALIAGMNNTMPVIGGEIVEEEFMADYEIAGGYLELVRWSERSGANLASSDIPLFLQNQTVFKGTQRYDGKPARGEAFVAVNYHNVAVTTSKSFEIDYENEGIGTLIVTTAAGTSSGKTVVTVAGASNKASLKYKKAGTPLAVTNGQKLGTGWLTIASGDAITAETGAYLTVVELDSAGKAIKTGAGVATAM